MTREDEMIEAYSAEASSPAGVSCAAASGYAPMWEYHTEHDLNYIKDVILKRLGSEGWEMCGCHVTRENEVVCYFKRLRSHTIETHPTGDE